MKDKLGYGHDAIYWYVDGAEGAGVGQEVHLSLRDLETKLKAADDLSDRMYWAVEIAAKKWMLKTPSRCSLHWKDRIEVRGQAARDLMSVCKAAMAACRSSRPWPEWAIAAKAAGWKPPKGWEPAP